MSTARKFKKVGLRRALTEIGTFHFACLRETPNGIDANAFCLGRNICDRSAYIQCHLRTKSSSAINEIIRCILVVYVGLLIEDMCNEDWWQYKGGASKERLCK